ncbi:MAG: helix-turn-helix domain-containing protein [Planctomycetes bacterium]|nr:helix-turn-helix domain-containing protein [Planctomycetota bacterium]
MSYEILGHRQVEAWLRLPRGSVLRWARQGLIPCIRLPNGEFRFDREALARWVDDGGHNG